MYHIVLKKQCSPPYTSGEPKEHIKGFKESIISTHTLFIYFISASAEHLKWLRSQIILTKGLKGSISKTVDFRTNKRGSSMHRLKYSTKEAKKLLKWIYYKNNLPCLKRKYNIARPFLSA